MFKKKLFMTLIKISKADFIQGDYHDSCRDHCNVVLQWGREIGLKLGIQLGELGMYSQVEGWGKNYSEERNMKIRGILAKQT